MGLKYNVRSIDSSNLNRYWNPYNLKTRFTLSLARQKIVKVLKKGGRICKQEKQYESYNVLFLFLMNFHE